MLDITLVDQSGEHDSLVSTMSYAILTLIDSNDLEAAIGKEMMMMLGIVISTFHDSIARSRSIQSLD